MKRSFWALLAVAVFFGVAAIYACPKGTTEYEGACAAEPQPVNDGMFLVDVVKPSDEKPPKGVQNPCERMEVVCATPPSLISQDQKQDEEVAQANTDGKRIAGLK